MSMTLIPQSWHKSSYSANGANCVECRSTDRAVCMRDTQNRKAGQLSFPTSEWDAFLADVRAGRL